MKNVARFVDLEIEPASETALDPAHFWAVFDAAYEPCPEGDYKDYAATLSAALGHAECTLRVKFGAPDGSMCPKAFLAWWHDSVGTVLPDRV